MKTDLQKKADKVWRDANKETLREYNVRWLEKHPDYRKKYYDANRDRLKQYNRSNTIRRKNNHLLRIYGITFEQMTQMYVAQGGVCAIHKGKFLNGRDIHVDHNHETGQVRQLLCSRCNVLLGMSNEDVSRLMGAVEYLNRWNNPITLPK